MHVSDGTEGISYPSGPYVSQWKRKLSLLLQMEHIVRSLALMKC